MLKKVKTRDSITLNTYKDNGFDPILPQDGTEWVFLLDWLELAFSKEQLMRVKDKWNDGMEVEKNR